MQRAIRAENVLRSRRREVQSPGSPLPLAVNQNPVFQPLEFPGALEITGKKSAKPKDPPPATNPTISQDKTAGTEEAQAELLAFLAQKLRLLVCSMLLSFSIPL